MPRVQESRPNLKRKKKNAGEKRHGTDVDVREYHFGAVLVDPPRAGLDATTLKLVQGYPHILYISCNPCGALAEQARVLNETHRLENLAVFAEDADGLLTFNEHNWLSGVD